MLLVELSNHELVALGCAIKEDKLKELKRGLAPGAHNVDFTVRINGSITKAASTPSSSGFADPVVNLRSFDTLCAVMRQLGIGPTRLMDALAAVESPDKIVADEKLAAVFTAEEAKRAARLPKVPTTTEGRSGNTSVLATVTKIVKAAKKKS